MWIPKASTHLICYIYNKDKDECSETFYRMSVHFSMSYRLFALIEAMKYLMKFSASTSTYFLNVQINCSQLAKIEKYILYISLPWNL